MPLRDDPEAAAAIDRRAKATQLAKRKEREARNQFARNRVTRNQMPTRNIPYKYLIYKRKGAFRLLFSFIPR